MFKKFISILLSMAVLIGIFSLSTAFASDKNELLIGINTPYLPFEENVNGEYVGYDIDVMNYICKQLNLTPKYIDMEFDRLIPGLISNETNCVISAITATEERLKYANFTRPYFIGTFIYPDEKTNSFERFSIALSKGSSYLHKFNEIIFEAEKNGTLKNIAAKYDLVYDDSMLSSKDTNASAQYIICRDDRSVKNPNNSENYLLKYYYDKVILNPLVSNSQNINQLIQKDCDNFFIDNDDYWIIDNPPRHENETYINSCRAVVTKNDGNIFSIKICTDWYAGGVYNTGYYGLNYNLKTGTNITLSEIFSLPDDETLNYLKECSKKYIDLHSHMWWNDDII